MNVEQFPRRHRIDLNEAEDFQLTNTKNITGRK